jgi:hypothetical protein
MSFDLAFWYEHRPSTVERAAEIYDRLTDGQIGVVEKSTEVGSFLAELVSRFPDLTEENADGSP